MPDSSFPPNRLPHRSSLPLPNSAVPGSPLASASGDEGSTALGAALGSGNSRLSEKPALSSKKPALSSKKPAISLPLPMSLSRCLGFGLLAFIAGGLGAGGLAWQVRGQGIPVAAPATLTSTGNELYLVPTDPGVSAPAAVNLLKQAGLALQQRQGSMALQALTDLEQQLPALTDQILLMRAEAYELALNPGAAEQTWTQVLTQFPDSPVAARALLGLGRTQELISRFPQHPLSASVLMQSLAQQPQNFTLIRALAAYHPNTPKLLALVNRWVQAQSAQLSPQDWEIIGNVYWDNREFGKASRAYAKSPLTARNLYRRGRSHHLSNEKAAAITAYQGVLTQFPDDPITSLTRQRLILIADASTSSLLVPLASQSTPEAADALLALATLSAKSGNATAAQSWREQLWQRFPSSAAAASAAWQVAWPLAQKGDLSNAIAIARRIELAQRDTEEGAQLVFWAGKWLEKQGKTQEARQEYLRVLQSSPHTYYAWRAASRLGLPVGDFTAGRLPVTVNANPWVGELPGVSPQVQLLHLAGLEQDAWERWQWEVDTNGDLTNAQSFVTGLLRNAAGDHLEGINQVTSLRFKDSSTDPQLEELRQRPDFWQSIYPLHFVEAGMIEKAQAVNLNPLLVAALIRQESRFEKSIVSSAGATGLMQVMPSTGAWIASKTGIPNYQLANPADNLRMGSWYLDYTHRTYNNNSILAVASYNAGPGNVAKWVKQFGVSDLDEFVERIPFSETRGYVKSVFGNYWNYWQLYTSDGRTVLEQARLATP